MELPTDETDALVHSLKRYLSEEFDLDPSDLKARLLLNFVWDEVAPFAYNRGVEEAQSLLRRQVEDLPNVCFREGLTYWRDR